MDKLFGKNASKILTAEQILKTEDMEKRYVEIPEWRGGVWVKTMTGEERDLFEVSLIEERGEDDVFNSKNIRAKLVAMTACDEKGKLIFRQDQVEALGKKNGAALQRIYIVSAKLNKISKEDVEELTESLKKNPFGDLPSNSANISEA